MYFSPNEAHHLAYIINSKAKSITLLLRWGSVSLYCPLLDMKVSIQFLVLKFITLITVLVINLVKVSQKYYIFVKNEKIYREII